MMRYELFVAVASVAAVLAGPLAAQHVVGSEPVPPPGAGDVPEVLEQPLGELEKAPDEISDGVLAEEKLLNRPVEELPRRVPNAAALSDDHRDADEQDAKRVRPPYPLRPPQVE